MRARSTSARHGRSASPTSTPPRQRGRRHRVPGAEPVRPAERRRERLRRPPAGPRVADRPPPAARRRRASCSPRSGWTSIPARPLDELSPAQQQLVEIAKALSLDAKLLLFDEPTAALSPAEADRLFGVIAVAAAARASAVIYISHRLEEVFALADRVTVLKDGAGQGTFAGRRPDARRAGGEDGRPGRGRPPAAGRPAARGRPGRARGARPADADDRPVRLGVSFAVRAGEIVGLAGLVGAGRTELALALFGARPGYAGEVLRRRPAGRTRGPRPTRSPPGSATCPRTARTAGCSST